MTTKEKILDIARKLFAENGFDGTSIRDIAAAATVNLGSISYYFGNKEKLFATVINHQLAPLEEKMIAVVQGNGSVQEKISQLLHLQAFFILKRDKAARAIFAEAAIGGRRLPQLAQASLRRRHQLISSVIEAGIKQGVFRKCNPEYATWSLLGMVGIYMVMRPIIQPTEESQPYDDTFINRVVDTARELFFSGIEAKKE